ncbi:MAG TPA: Yip1 family protein [Acidobacteriota bacterium]|nr:Yip1 family protein [Acidobacteriota bacterium]
MDIVGRVQAILVKPKDEWVTIKAEPATAAGLFTSYAMILAAVPPGFQFLRRILIERLPMIGHWPFGRALASAVVAYVLSLLTVYLFALVVNELAPNFGSTKSMTNALKLTVYSMTPVWLAGVFGLFAGLWPLGVLASLYGFYILYLGFNAPLMGTPKDKAPGYLAVSILVAIGIYVVVNWFLRVIFAVRYGRL